MGLENIKPNEVKIKLGGKEWEVRFPVRAFMALQEKFGGWKKAWQKLAESVEGDLNYEVFIEFLVIGINKPEATTETVKEWVYDLFQDEIADILVAIQSASRRYLPQSDGKENPQK